MKISLGMPYWGQDPTRARNFEYAWEYMGKIWNWWDAEWRVPLDAKTRGGARNHLVRHLASLGADVVVLCDADTFVSQSTMLSAVNAAYSLGGLHYPYNAYHYLTNEATETLIAGQYAYLEDLACDMKGPGSYGGCMAIRPDEWERAGGSPELNGWGFEDIIFSIQARGLLDTDNQWYDGTLYHLYHPSECNPDDVQYQRNIEVCRRYERAAGDEAAIRQLISETHSASH